MPYKSNVELPDSVKNSLPSHAQDIFKEAFNSAYKEYGEERAFKIAWAAVKNSYKQEGDKWVKKSLGSSESYFYCQLKKSFELQKSMVAEEGVPEELKGLGISFKPGARYSWGEITDTDIDHQGHRVYVPDDVLKNLVKPPFNKTYIGHQNMGFAAGMIEFAGRIPNVKNPVIVERLQEGNPQADSIWKSQQEGDFDSYSIKGRYASDRMNIDGMLADVLRVTWLQEVSKIGNPVNEKAKRRGMFIAKSMSAGGLFDVHGGHEKMEEETILELKKSFDDLKGKVDVLEKALGEKLGEKPEEGKPAESKPDEKPVEVKPEEQKPTEGKTDEIAELKKGMIELKDTITTLMKNTKTQFPGKMGEVEKGMTGKKTDVDEWNEFVHGKRGRL